MPHIALPNVPGIIGPLTAYRETERHLDGLANALMCGPSSLSRAEREMIATYVSSGNECCFCTNSHAAVARHLLGERCEIVAEILANVDQAPIDDKLRALLVIAGKVRRDGRLVTDADVQRARDAGADDKAIHDTVLIAAAFCMFNRYVDGLATWTPEDPKVYEEIGARIANNGYGSRFRATINTSTDCTDVTD
jgi:uncharacterized peroxidase-related enzyme